MYSVYFRNKYFKFVVKIKNFFVFIFGEYNFFFVLFGESFEKYFFEGVGFCLIFIFLDFLCIFNVL